MTIDDQFFQSSPNSKGKTIASKLGIKKHRKPSASKRSEFRERSNLMLSTASLGVGVASLVLALNRKGDSSTPGTGSEPCVQDHEMRKQAATASRNPPSLKRLTPQDVESTCRGKRITRIVLKASGGNIGSYIYEPGVGERIVSDWGTLMYWKKERQGDCIYYLLGH